MKQRIFSSLFFVLFCAFIYTNDAVAAVNNYCRWLTSKTGSVSADTSLVGRNCRERAVDYIQNPTTKAITAVIGCTSCYDGYTLTYKTGTADNDCGNISYATCVQSGVSGLVLSCSSTTCSGTPVVENDLIWSDDLSKFRGSSSSIRCFKKAAIGGSGTGSQAKFITIGCNNDPEELTSYDEDYKVSFYISALGCGAGVPNCVPKYDAYCPTDCPFRGWEKPKQSSDPYLMKRCVRAQTSFVGTCESSCEAGYQYTRTGCVKCDSSLVCLVGQVPKCASGYYGTMSLTTGKITCYQCPSVKTTSGVTVKGKSATGATSITQCYLSSGTYKDDTGTFSVTSTCYYSNS